MNINFDTRDLSREEATGLTALMVAISPALLPMEEHRARHDRMYGSASTLGLSASAGAPAASYAAPAPTGETSDAPTTTNTPRAGESEDQAKARTRTRKTKEDTKQAISTGEERVNPEEAEQDKADEQAEVEAKRDAEAPLTIEDVKAAVGLYVSAYGLDAAQADGPAFFEKVLGKAPEGEKSWRMTLIAAKASQKQLSEVVAFWKAAAETNPNGREAV